MNMKLTIKILVILVLLLSPGWLGIYGMEPGITRGSNEPELWVCLESITFNHDPVYSSCDAINIRKNCKEPLHIPEWTCSGEPQPAAYLKNKSITVKAVFSAAPGVSSALINAETTSGNLGNLVQTTVCFKNGHSDPVYFQVSHPTPVKIKTFDQEWQWYAGSVNGTGSSRVYIGNSKNKIYIVLSEPQCPWTTRGPAAPWTDVLDYACAWADGQTTAEGAAEKITHRLYNDIGGSYQREGDKYTGGPRSESFCLTDFLKHIPHIGDVSCHDMGKALVTFANVVGCGLNYRLSEPFGDKLHCIIPIGLCRSCGLEFANHAFGSIGDYIFDACLKVEVDKNPDQPAHISAWMTNIYWERYKQKVIKKGTAFYPETYSFGISMGCPCK